MYKEALKYAEQGVFLDNISVGCIFFLALSYSVKGNTLEAIIEYLRIIKINPNFSPAYLNLAQLLNKQGKSSYSIHFYKQCLDVDKFVKRNSKHLLNLAIFCKQTKNYEDAKKFLLEYIEVDKDN